MKVIRLLHRRATCDGNARLPRVYCLDTLRNHVEASPHAANAIVNVTRPVDRHDHIIK
jgi:hypothetical protein